MTAACNAIGVLLCAVWFYILAVRIFWGRPFSLAPPAVRFVSDPGRRRSIAAVVPARDEAAFVAHALESLSAQRFAGLFRIVLADDGSRDATAAIASRYATVVRGSTPPDGWTGKLWALSQGIAQAGAPDYYLLTDADIVHSRDNLSSLVNRIEAGPYDLVSYMVQLRCRSFAERALIPAFVFFFFLLYPPGRRASGAAGGCILIRREAVERIGGLAAIKGELIDDCALARAVKRSGGRVWLGVTRSAESIREYPAFADIARMISRTAFTQLRYSPWILAVTILALTFAYLLPPALTLTGNLYAAAAWLLMALSYLPAVRFYRQNWLWAPLLPAIAAFYMFCTVHSALQYWRGQGGQWKGRFVAHG